MANIGVINANAADIYRYMNFDQIKGLQRRSGYRPLVTSSGLQKRPAKRAVLFMLLI